MKNGIKTTEFWLVVVSNLITISGYLKGTIDPQTSTIVIAVLNSIYAILRTLAKNPDITTFVKTENKQ